MSNIYLKFSELIVIAIAGCSHLFSVHEALFFGQVHDLQWNVCLTTRLVLNSAIISAHHATFPTRHLYRENMLSCRADTTSRSSGLSKRELAPKTDKIK